MATLCAFFQTFYKKFVKAATKQSQMVKIKCRRIKKASLKKDQAAIIR